MGQALYRSYRSKSFDEVIGQDHITKTLKTAIKTGRISHAYLFSGPRGVGKTSVARILAHEVNKLPYTGEEIHLDIIEIDAASNRRIDEIRNLRDKVHITPTSAKYKVYIIDEVHMLTKEAFNALLKTLEEPPEHCIFILATTESHKLPETIISRTQHFNFKAADPAQAASHLESIAKSEKINIDREALELIAKHSGGSFRDSISLLDQLSSLGKHISTKDVQMHFGLPRTETIDRLIAAIDAHQPAEVLSTLSEMNEVATDPLALAKALSDCLRQRVSANKSQPSDFYLLKELLTIPSSAQPAESLEILLLEVSTDTTSPLPQPIVAPKQDSKLTPKEGSKKKEVEQEETVVVKIEDKADADAPEVIAEAVVGEFDLEKWEELLVHIKSKTASLYTALRLATPINEDGRLKLCFEFPLHQKKINQASNKDIISKAIETLFGQKISLECVVDKNLAQAGNPEEQDFYKAEKSDSGSLKAISNIFGNAEVLES